MGPCLGVRAATARELAPRVCAVPCLTPKKKLRPATLLFPANMVVFLQGLGGVGAVVDKGLRVAVGWRLSVCGCVPVCLGELARLSATVHVCMSGCCVRVRVCAHALSTAHARACMRVPVCSLCAV